MKLTSRQQTNHNKRVNNKKSWWWGMGKIIVLAGLLLAMSGTKVWGQTANSFYFSPATAIVNLSTQTTLRANLGTNSVNFIGVNIKIDITKVKLANISYPLETLGAMSTVVPGPKTQSQIDLINCAPVSGDSSTTNCKNGVITFALAVYPGTSNTARTGIVDLALIGLSSVVTGATTTSQITFVGSGNEIVNSATGLDLSLSTSPMSLTVYPVTVPTAIPTATPAVTCKTCPSNFSCYFNQSTNEYRWFVSGYVPGGFVSSTVTNCGGVGKPGFIGKSAGDANCDGYVNGTDYSIWRREYLDISLTQPVVRNTWEADFTGVSGVCDGMVSGYDYSLWRRGYRGI